MPTDREPRNSRSTGPDFIKQDQDLSQNFEEKKSNWSKTCNIAATSLEFCDKQRGLALLLVTQFQACSCNIAGFRPIQKYSKFWLKPGSRLTKSCPGCNTVQIVHVPRCATYSEIHGLRFLCIISDFSTCRAIMLNAVLFYQTPLLDSEQRTVHCTVCSPMYMRDRCLKG